MSPHFTHESHRLWNTWFPGSHMPTQVATPWGTLHPCILCPEWELQAQTQLFVLLKVPPLQTSEPWIQPPACLCPTGLPRQKWTESYLLESSVMAFEACFGPISITVSVWPCTHSLILPRPGGTQIEFPVLFVDDV